MAVRFIDPMEDNNIYADLSVSMDIARKDRKMP